MSSNENALAAFGSRPAPVLSAAARKLIRSFSYASLGDGNATAGMNTLVSMCASLSAVAGPNARIENQAGEVFPVGINWLVSGSLSPALQASRVLTPLWNLQSNLSDSVDLAEKKRSAYQESLRRKSVGETMGTSRPLSPISPEMLLEAKDKLLFGEILGKSATFDEPDLVRAAARLLQPRAFSNLPELARNPAVIHNGTNPKALSKELARSHRRHPLVDFPLNGRAEAHAIEGACLGVIDGTGVPGKFPAPVRGLCTARMQKDVFADIAKQRDSPVWLKRMLWLTDTKLVAADAPRPTLELDRMQLRYEDAVTRVLVARLGEKKNSIEWDLPTKTHYAWVAYLGKLERHFPGISGSLANLLPTLTFGFYKLAMAAGGCPAGFGLSADAILALAKHLADRMIHLRSVLQDEELTAFKRRIAGSILTKLGEGPHSDAELVRRHNKLLIGPCREILAGLQSAGLVRRTGERWELQGGLDTAPPQPPVIDVI